MGGRRPQSHRASNVSCEQNSNQTPSCGASPQLFGYLWVSLGAPSSPAAGARVGSLFSVQRNCAPVLVSLLPIVVSLGAPSSPRHWGECGLSFLSSAKIARQY